MKNDLKEARYSLKEKLTQLKSVESKLKRENEQLKAELITFKHLPAEHAKLKVRFLCELKIITILTQIKCFYRMILEHYLLRMKSLKQILEPGWILKN